MLANDWTAFILPVYFVHLRWWLGQERHLAWKLVQTHLSGSQFNEINKEKLLLKWLMTSAPLTPQKRSHILELAVVNNPLTGHSGNTSLYNWTFLACTTGFHSATHSQQRSLQSDWLGAMLTVSVNVSWLDLKSSMTVFIEVIQGRNDQVLSSILAVPGDAVNICLASTHPMCANTERCCACIVKVKTDKTGANQTQTMEPHQTETSSVASHTSESGNSSGHFIRALGPTATRVEQCFTLIINIASHKSSNRHPWHLLVQKAGNPGTYWRCGICQRPSLY